MPAIEFANPEILYALLIIPVMLAFYIWKQSSWVGSYTISSVGKTWKANWKVRTRHLPFVLRLVAVAALVFALARPQSSLSWADETTEGIDIVISMDISGSMLAEDLKPNRLEAAKNVGIEFVESRVNDRIGLVIYGSESFTQCPLTTDHDVIKNLFSQVKFGMIKDGTAIGHGLGTAVSRLKESSAKSKVIILLTDGQNTAGNIPPLTAAEMAKKFGIRVYCIGVGTNGKAPYPGQDIFGRKVYQQIEVKIDEETLKSIADLTNGAYFRATDNKSLANVYEEIDRLEKSKIKVTEYQKKNEHFWPLALLALAVLFGEFGLKKLIYRTLT